MMSPILYGYTVPYGALERKTLEYNLRFGVIMIHTYTFCIMSHSVLCLS